MKLYYNIKKDTLWVIKNGEILESVTMGNRSDKLVREYCNKAYGTKSFTKINTLAEIF